MTDIGDELCLQLIEPLVGGAQLLRAQEDFRFHLFGAHLERLGQAIPLETLLFEMHELGDVLDAMDDVLEPTSLSCQDRGVDGTPVSFLESAALGFRAADVVFLHRHRVGSAGVAHPLERGAQIAHAGRARILGVVWKGLEDPPAEQILAPRHGRAEVGIACRDDHEIRPQHQVESRRRLEQRAEIRHPRLVGRCGEVGKRGRHGWRTIYRSPGVSRVR